MVKGYRNINDETKDAYLDWLMAPPVERDPATKEEVAEKLGVARSTLYLWENTPQFQEQLRMLKTRWGIKFHGEILGRLIEWESFAHLLCGPDSGRIAGDARMLQATIPMAYDDKNV